MTSYAINFSIILLNDDLPNCLDLFFFGSDPVACHCFFTSISLINRPNNIPIKFCSQAGSYKETPLKQLFIPLLRTSEENKKNNSSDKGSC